MKAKKKVVKAIPKKSKPRQASQSKKEKQQPKPPNPLRSSIIVRSIAETLQNTTLGDGEFDLPSILMRTLDKNDPKYSLGLHREPYIPMVYNASFYGKTSERAMMIFMNQATVVAPAIIGEGIPRKLKELDPPLCKDCE